MLRDFKKAQVPPGLRKRPNGTKSEAVLDEAVLEEQYSLRHSAVMFFSMLGLALMAAGTAFFLFHERSGVASPRAWWLLLTSTNAALLLYALWSWVVEDVQGRKADSWLFSLLGTFLSSVARGDGGSATPSPPLSPKRPLYPVPPDAWRCPWGPCVVVCFCYFYRSLWQHCTVERYCMEVWPRRHLDSATWPLAAPAVEVAFSPVVGRVIASVGEFVFVTCCMLPGALWGRDSWLRTPLTCLVALAEIVSDIGVVKRHYGFFAVENSLWVVLFSAVFASTLRCKWVAYSQTDRAERPSILVACRTLALVLAALLVLYNVLEDVPMYHRLYTEKVVVGQADAASPHYGRYDLPFASGLAHGLRCHQMLDVDDERWRPFMLWMALNYVALPAWMCFVCAITARRMIVGFNGRVGR